MEILNLQFLTPGEDIRLHDGQSLRGHDALDRLLLFS